jgi:restriction system protein
MKSFRYNTDDLFNPALQALHALGGSATIAEMEDRVARDLRLSDEDLSIMHRGNRTKFGYRLAWARTYLKNYGVIENSSQGVWALTAQGRQTRSVDKEAVKRHLAQRYTDDGDVESAVAGQETTEETEAELNWQSELLEVLLGMDPAQFERLCQRVLRELGFINVEVTGRAGDGGIDGKGVLRVGGVLSFHVLFQCKRYRGSISPSQIRDFRGSLMGRADKGLFITTGTFTREATREAQRDGASPIDLIDGTQLMDIMKDLELGVKKYQVERVEIRKDWFQSI